MFPAFGGPLMEALPQEVWAVQTAHDRAGVATLAGDRRDAAVTLQGGGRCPAGAILSVGGKQTRSEGAAGPGQRPKEGVVLKGGGQFLNATLDEIETLGKNLELAHERFHAQDQRRDGIDILGKRAGTGEDIETFVEALFTAAAVSFPKGLERRWARLAKRLQGWPSLQKFTVHGTPEVFAQQLEGLRKVEFEKGLEPVGKCRAFIYEGAPMLDQAAQVAHRAAGAFERPQFTMIMECVASDHRGVGAVAVRVA